MLKINTRVKESISNPLIKNSLIYALTDGVCKALSFILLPFVSYYLLPDELGIVANFDVLQSILVLLAGQATVNALAYFYYDRSHKKVAELVSSLLFIIIALSVIFVIIIFFSTDIINQYLGLTIGLQILAVVTSVLNLLYGINMILYRLEDKPHVFAKLQLLTAFIQIGLLVLLVMNFKMGALGKIISSIGGYTLLSGLHLFLLFKRGYITKNISIEAIKQLLNFQIPLLPHSLSFWIKSGLDKVLLTTYCGLTANGLYSMSLSFGAIYTLFTQSFMMAYTPYLQKRINSMKSDNEKEEKSSFVRQSYLISILFIGLFFFVVAGCWLVIRYLLSDKYLDSFQFIPYIMFSQMIYAFYNLVIQFPYTVKKTMGLGAITFAGSCIQIFITYVLVRSIGINGIKYSMVIGSLIIMLGVWWYSNRVYPLPWFSFAKSKE